MSRILTLRFLPLLVLALVLAGGCGKDEITAPNSVAPDDTSTLVPASEQLELASQEIVRAFGWDIESGATELAKSAPHIASNFESQTIVGSVVHYSADVRVGDGPYDVIRVHRVVDESLPRGQRRRASNIFLLHGDGVGFVKFVFGSATPVLPDDQSVAVYLARAGVDVWGMDQNWALVPGGLADYSFAADWGLQNQIETLDAGLAVARIIRLVTGFGPGKMNLLGYSSGGLTGYAYVNEQTQRPNFARHVGGYVVADIPYKYSPEFAASQAAGCEFKAFYEASLAAQEYDLGFGFLAAVGELAETAPDDLSPIVPGLTNLQAALAIVSLPDGTSFGAPWYKFFAPVIQDDFPVDLAYTQTAAMLDFLQLFLPFEPVAFARDYTAVWCEDEDVPWDDFLADVDVPVLSLQAHGGLGVTSTFTLDLLGSTDKSIISASVVSDPVVDFGHVDLWTADNAAELAWAPLLDWIEAHPQRHRGGRVGPVARRHYDEGAGSP